MIPKLSLPVIGKWSSIFQLGFRRIESSRTENDIGDKNDKNESKFEEEEEDTDDSDDEKSKNFSEESYSHPIPKNALILTRCSSAPYRSSSLASRFWESPMNNDSEEKQSDERIAEAEERVDSEEKGDESEAPIKEEEEEEKRTEEVDLGLGLGQAILTRCKSEPARIGEKLYPEIGYWSNNNFSRGRRRRLGFVDYCD